MRLLNWVRERLLRQETIHRLLDACREGGGGFFIRAAERDEYLRGFEGGASSRLDAVIVKASVTLNLCRKKGEGTKGSH